MTKAYVARMKRDFAIGLRKCQKRKNSEESKDEIPEIDTICRMVKENANELAC